MNAKNYRRNTNFQIINFILGSCQTIDGAYALCCEQLDTIKRNYKNLESSKIKQEAVLNKIYWKLWSPFRFHRLEAKAQLLEIENSKEFDEKAIQAVKDECNFWEQCKQCLEPKRKYSNLPDAQAFEAAQNDEWKFELIKRCENSIICTGVVAPDDFDAIRMHPEYKELLHRVDELRALGQSGFIPLEKMLPRPTFLPTNLLLEGPEDGASTVIK